MPVGLERGRMLDHDDRGRVGDVLPTLDHHLHAAEEIPGPQDEVAVRDDNLPQEITRRPEHQQREDREDADRQEPEGKEQQRPQPANHDPLSPAIVRLLWEAPG